VGDKLLQLGTSAAQMAGAQAGAARDPVHSDLVFAHPALVATPAAPDGGTPASDGGTNGTGDGGQAPAPDMAQVPLPLGTPALEVQLGMGGFRDVQDPATAGVYVQILGAFSPAVETGPQDPGAVAGGCQCALSPARPPLLALGIALLLLTVGLARKIRRR
jgi:hypothetical protein